MLRLRALSSVFRSAYRAHATERRREVLRDLDHLAGWREQIDVKALNPAASGGGGCKVSSTDRSDRANEDHEALDRAQRIQRRLQRIIAEGQTETRLLALLWFVCSLGRTLTEQSHPISSPPGPGAMARAAAVLEWLAFRCTASDRKRLASAVGWAFVDSKTHALWVLDPQVGREGAKRHGTELLDLAERAWFG